MTTPRTGHTATLLHNGKVLIAGGVREIAFGGVNLALATVELYDPSTGAFTATGAMTTSRAWHTATVLPDGRVLIAGGEDGTDNLLRSAEVYDPSAGSFTATGEMITAQRCHGATLVAGGKVLIAAGTARDAELFDPVHGTFFPAGNYANRSADFNTCESAVSTLLRDGRVLIVWEGGSTEVYDPESGAFSATGATLAGGYCDGLPTATLLMNGKVLVAGGACGGGLSLTGAELYDSSIGTLTATGDMITGHVSHTATLLPDGTVLMAGSFLFPGERANAELYGSVTGAFTATGSLITARGGGQTATLLNNGEVLFTGGFSRYPATTSNAEIYHPAVLVPAPRLFSVSGDGRGQGAIWHATTGEIASPARPAVGGEALSLYTTSLFIDGLIPPQVTIGGQLAEILYFGAAPGYPAYKQVNFRVPDGVAPGPAVPVRLTYISRPSNEVTIGVQ